MGGDDDESLWQFMQAAARVDRGSLAGLVGVDELIGQPQFVAEFDPGWFLG
jgi:hypothetical protein